MTVIVTYFYRKDHSSSVFPRNFLSPNSPQTIFATRRVRIQNLNWRWPCVCKAADLSGNINQSFCLSELAGEYGSGQKI